MATRATHQLAADGRAGEGEADGDDHRTGDDGREEAHDLLCAEELEQQGQNQVQGAGAGHAKAGVGQGDVSTAGGYQTIGAQKGKAGAEERGDLALGDEVEQQRAQAGKQQRGRDAQAGNGGNQNGGAEHGEHVLQAQHKHPRHAQFARVVDAGLGDRFFAHKKTPLLPLPVRSRSGRGTLCRKKTEAPLLPSNTNSIPFQRCARRGRKHGRNGPANHYNVHCKAPLQIYLSKCIKFRAE